MRYQKYFFSLRSTLFLALILMPTLALSTTYWFTRFGNSLPNVYTCGSAVQACAAGDQYIESFDHIDVRVSTSPNIANTLCEGTYFITTWSDPIPAELSYTLANAGLCDCPSGTAEDSSGQCVETKLEPDHKQPNEGCTPKVGDPIIVATGNSFQTEVDYQSLNPFGLSFIRYYNSSSNAVDKGVGKKWRHQYNYKVDVIGDLALVRRSTGQTFIFNYDGSNWQSDVDIPDTLVELKDTAGNRIGWVYTDSHDNVERYNLSGQLIYITNRQGQAKVLNYDIAVIDGGDGNNATLDKVTGFNNEVMTFTYDASNRISGMTDPQGNIYLYTYDSASNLIKVTYPDNTAGDDTDNPTRTYHYENATFPYHLTGRTDETGSLVTWAFDSQGRAISNELASGTEKYTLVFNADDSVTTTNPLGKDTTYHFTTLHGVKKVTQVEGHASQSCVAANKNYSYDANGYLASKTDWQGKVTTYVHDARGLETSRTEAFGTTEARTITTDWHATFRLPIKITEPGKVTDYSYDAQGRLTSQTVSTP